MSDDNSSISASRKNITLAFWLNIIFACAEVIGGFLINSMAILSDALHDFGDSFSLGLAWYFSKIAEKKSTRSFSYGFKRFSLLSALINSIVLVAGSILIMSKAIPRLIHPEHFNAEGMLFFAFIGIAINGIAALRLHRGKTMNERVVMWHLLEDIFGWVAILMVAIVTMFKEIYILDPVLSIIIMLYILWNVMKNLKKTVNLFLQGVPDSLTIELVESEMKKSEDIKGVHDTHIWSLDGEHHILTAHVIISANATCDDANRVKCEVKKLLEKFDIRHATIEIEYEGERCEI
ncbi:MAG: cation diffusion facilitator family transporter [Candidatus Ratteibacteria bacterium]|nr:cation diffusion facilitator family transporter [Candidatus Ratteibacteria bacterium]